MRPAAFHSDSTKASHDDSADADTNVRLAGRQGRSSLDSSERGVGNDSNMRPAADQAESTKVTHEDAADADYIARLAASHGRSTVVAKEQGVGVDNNDRLAGSQDLSSLVAHERDAAVDNNMHLAAHRAESANVSNKGGVDADNNIRLEGIRGRPSLLANERGVGNDTKMTPSEHQAESTHVSNESGADAGTNVRLAGSQGRPSVVSNEQGVGDASSKQRRGLQFVDLGDDDYLGISEISDIWGERLDSVYPDNLEEVGCYSNYYGRFAGSFRSPSSCRQFSDAGAVLKSLPGAEPVKCNYIDGGEANGYITLIQVGGWSVEGYQIKTCEEFADVLNSFPGISNIACKNVKVRTSDGDSWTVSDDVYELTPALGAKDGTDCDAAAAQLNEILPKMLSCNKVGAYQFDGTCDCADPATGIGPTCTEFSNSKTCNDAGIAQYNGTCLCSDPAIGLGPTCSEFNNSYNCNDAGVVQPGGACNCTNPAIGTGPTCVEFSNIVTCNSAGVAQPDGTCLCSEGYTGNNCEYAASGCTISTAQSAAIEAAAAKVALEKILPATIGVSIAAVAIAYIVMIWASETSFGDLSKASHMWAWFSVGFKTFDLSTDWSFFFNSIRGASFESVYRYEGHSDFATRPPVERRYDESVVTIQFAVMFFCTVGTVLTFADYGGSYLRMLTGSSGTNQPAHAKTSFMITLCVIIFEDIPQLVFVVIYMTTIAEANVGDIDEIAIISLIASSINILYQIFLLCKDSKAAEKKDAVKGKEPFGFAMTAM